MNWGEVQKDPNPPLMGIHKGVAPSARARLDGLHLLLLGALIFIAIGLVADIVIPLPLPDFMIIYYGGRCLVQHHDPYQVSQFWSVYQAQGGFVPSDPRVLHGLRPLIAICVNLPTTLVLAIPLAVLPWKLAAAICLVLIGGSFILACCYLWGSAAAWGPRHSGLLVLLVLINSGFLLYSGNVSGLVISLCVISVCSFVRERFIWAGVVCMAASLLIKPHDAAFVWIYFFLAGGIPRKRAVQSVVLAAAVALPSIIWVSHVAPNWLQEYRSNVVAEMAPGGISDPGPTADRAHGSEMVISLQTVLSLIRNDPHFYNPITYVLCGTLLVVWCVKTLRSSFSPERAWLALAAISALTLLPIYHRRYDARLLLLTIPACVMLWKRGGPIGRSAVLLTLGAIVITGDVFWIVFFNLTHYSVNSGIQAMAIEPLILLALGVFYLWVYLRDAPMHPSTEGGESSVGSCAAHSGPGAGTWISGSTIVLTPVIPKSYGQGKWILPIIGS